MYFKRIAKLCILALIIQYIAAAPVQAQPMPPEDMACVASGCSASSEEATQNFLTYILTAERKAQGVADTDQAGSDASLVRAALMYYGVVICVALLVTQYADLMPPAAAMVVHAAA